LIRIEYYNDHVRFLCHNTALLYTSVTVQMLKLHKAAYADFQGAFVRINPMNIRAKFEVRSSTRSWDNRGYSKNLGSPWIRPRSFFSKIFHDRDQRPAFHPSAV